MFGNFSLKNEKKGRKIKEGNDAKESQWAGPDLKKINLKIGPAWPSQICCEQTTVS